MIRWRSLPTLPILHRSKTCGSHIGHGQPEQAQPCASLTHDTTCPPLQPFCIYRVMRQWYTALRIVNTISLQRLVFIGTLRYLLNRTSRPGSSGPPCFLVSDDSPWSVSGPVVGGAAVTFFKVSCCELEAELPPGSDDRPMTGVVAVDRSGVKVRGDAADICIHGMPPLPLDVPGSPLGGCFAERAPPESVSLLPELYPVSEQSLATAILLPNSRGLLV